MSSNNFAVHHLGVTVWVSSNSEDIPAHLRKTYQLFPNDRDPGKERVSCSMFAKLASSGASHRLFRDGELILETEHYPFFLASLDAELFGALMSHARHHFLIHAGAVARQGSAAIFPGTHGAGKTTLVAYLVENGFEFFSDEVAALSYQTTSLEPFPRPLNIKAGSVGLLPTEGACLQIERYDQGAQTYEGRYALPPTARTAQGPARVRLVLFPQYIAGADTRLRKLPRSKAAVLLVNHAFNFKLDQAQGFDLVAALASRVPAYQLSYEKLPEALAVIENLLAESHSEIRESTMV